MLYRPLVAIVPAAGLAACLASGPRSTPPAAVEPSGREATCAAIATETRALVTEAVDFGGSPVSVDALLKAMAPLGTCVEPLVGGGAWALVLTEAPAIEGEELVDPADAYDEDGNPTRVPGTPVARTVVREWVPTFVTADGKRITCKDKFDVPDFDVFVDVAGSSTAPHWPHEEQIVDAGVETRANADGSFSVSFSNYSFVSLFRWNGTDVIVDPANTILPNLTGFNDFNKDGRVDLVDGDSLRIHMYGDSNFFRPLDLIAMALPDGSFTTTHPDIDAHYRTQCRDNGRSPWILGHADVYEALTNMACARLFGVPVATIKAGLEREKATVTENDDVQTIPAFELLDTSFEYVFEWLDEAMPVQVGRSDGFRSLEVASVTAVSAQKAFGVYRFDAGEAADGDLGTSWQPVKGRDAWIELKLKGPETIAALDIANGFQRTDKLGDLFALNSRATTVVVAVGGKTFELTLDPDKRGFQRLDLPEATSGDTVRITVKGSAKGLRWDHLAMSEILVLGR